MAEVASQILGEPVTFEISMTNVDKPPLDFIEMTRRAEQFGPSPSLWFTRSPTFAEKSQIFPGATFVVGADTIERIADPRYYGGDSTGRDRAIESIAARNGRFLVFGRVRDGVFQTLDDLSQTSSLRALCDSVPAEQFRLDLSSTEIRGSALDM